jgi:hypothetical protein
LLAKIIGVFGRSTARYHAGIRWRTLPSISSGGDRLAGQGGAIKHSDPRMKAEQDSRRRNAPPVRILGRVPSHLFSRWHHGGGQKGSGSLKRSGTEQAGHRAVEIGHFCLLRGLLIHRPETSL